MQLDHVNLRTARLAEMRRWYIEILGLVDGERPPFDSTGAWLYAGESPIVHLVETPKHPPPEGALRLEHFALRADEPMDGFLEKLKRAGIEAQLGYPPDADFVQVNIHDPDGNHIHIDFHGEHRRSA